MRLDGPTFLYPSSLIHFRSYSRPVKPLSLRTTVSSAQPLDSSPTRPRSETRCRQSVKRKVALIVAYEGSKYHGFQRNADVETISDVLEGALHSAHLISDDNLGFLEKIKWQVAARTDRGVSAAGNLVSAKLLFDRDELANGTAFIRAQTRINTFLPSHIRLLGINQITGSFNARACCEARWYEYLLPLSVLGGSASTLRNFNDIVSRFEGSHLFHNYTVGIDHCVPPRVQAQRFILECGCDLSPISWIDESGECELRMARVRIRGQSFMLHQIRKMISLAIMVIQKRVPSDAVERSFSPRTLINIAPAPPIGLFLDCCHFGWYNERQKKVLSQLLDMNDFSSARYEFKKSHIVPSIARRYLQDTSLQDFMKTIDRYPIRFD